MPQYVQKRKTNDTEPVFQYQLTRDGTAIDVSGDTSVDLYMEAPDGTMVLSGSAMTLSSDGTDGEVQYDFVDTDTSQSGVYQLEIVRNISTSESETFPKEGKLQIKVDPTLA